MTGAATYFHACYFVGDDRLWGVMRRRQGDDHIPAALKSIRAGRPGGYRLFVILGQPVGEQDPGDSALGQAGERRTVLHAGKRVRGNPIEAQSGPIRIFVVGGSDHPSHTVPTRKLEEYLDWRNAHARHPNELAAQRRERARVRGETLATLRTPSIPSRMTSPRACPQPDRETITLVQVNVELNPAAERRKIRSGEPDPAVLL